MKFSNGTFPGKGLQTIVFVGMALVLILAGYASWKQIERNKRIKVDVAVLEQEQERVRRENESLKERIRYFSTENFQEQESKGRLNMRKDNEYVVDIERIEKNTESDMKIVKNTDAKEGPIPNYKKWWEKIF